LTALGKFGLRA